MNVRSHQEAITIDTLQPCVCNRKLTPALAGIFLWIVGVSVSSAAPPKKSGPAPTRSPQPAVAATDSSKPITDAKDPTKVTRANFELIHNGLTEKEVTAMLGAPAGSKTQTGTVNGHPFNTKGMTWTSADRTETITVKLTDGKVSGKNWRKVTPKQP